MVSRRPSSVTDAAAVEKALARADNLGREQFREHYGFRAARSFFVRHDGKTYDSKPIVAVAFGYQHGTSPLAYNEFSGGAATVQPVLEKLGFAVVAHDIDDVPPSYTSEWLDVGEVYARDNLRELFSITDATSNNGVFRPKGSKSIWLFVTRDKAADRPQLHDDLTGDVLVWTGQPAGRTDQMLIKHLEEGNEVLLFYRENVRSYPNGGFRYEGPFLYRQHTGSKPAAFLFDRDRDSTTPGKPAKSADPHAFDPDNVADGRAKTLASVRLRQGQGKFRKELLAAYGGKCAISGCAIQPLLEAAHIHPYRGGQTNHVSNGLLLRADLHTLLDLGMIWLEDDGAVVASAELAGSGYEKLGRLRPARSGSASSAAALRWHRINVAKQAK